MRLDAGQTSVRLERFDAPATVFVTSGAVDSTQEFWWDELEQLLLRPSVLPSQLEIEIDGRAHRWALETDAKLAGGDQDIRRAAAVNGLAQELIERALDPTGGGGGQGRRALTASASPCSLRRL